MVAAWMRGRWRRLAKTDTVSRQWKEVSFMSRIALVTGANRGIGLEIVRQVARRGFHVVVAARDEASSGRAVKEIEAAGGRASFLSLDVSDSNSIREAAGGFATLSDRLDVLINNAGIYPDEGGDDCYRAPRPGGRDVSHEYVWPSSRLLKNSACGQILSR
jgi:NAD(P)-dependent dehydrogenase (short-subunit alcohol dehydrogenase family)